MEAVEGTDGSSPHGRGTATMAAWVMACPRFIPAWAGNSSQNVHGSGRLPVHPRMGGEQCLCPIAFCSKVGSSPHGRGTDCAVSSLMSSPRFIPAWAGNRAPPIVLMLKRQVHPRMGGEQSGPAQNGPVIPGSSPHGRGTARITPDSQR